MSAGSDALMGGPPARSEPVPMNPLGAEIAARFKEMFYAHTNGSARSQQTRLGPSEIGTPCDRRLAMSLMRHAPTNPGGDNWASWLGTQGHAGVAEMLLRADLSTGRFAVEQELRLPSVYVPHGTADLFDRMLHTIVDHKFMGGTALDHLRTEGPPERYRVQVHVYGYGHALRGEQVEHVALAAWPRDRATLRNLYVWTEPYDESVAVRALERVDHMAEIALNIPGARAEIFPATPDGCSFCPFFHRGGAAAGGCNGE